MPASSTSWWRPQGFDDRGEIGTRCCRIEAAQRVVGAEFEDDQIGVGRHRPVEAVATVGGRIAGNARIDNGGVDSLRLQRRFNCTGKAASGGKR